MSHPLTIVAKIVAKPGAEAQVEAALRRLIAPTLAEEGCLQYDLHRSLEDPHTFLFYENWQSKAAWQAHMETAHLQQMVREVEELLAGREILQMERVGE